MRITCATALMVLSTAIGSSQEPPPAPSTPAPATAPATAGPASTVAPAIPADPAAIPPTVRLPAPGPGVSDGVPPATSDPGGVPASGQFGWSGEGIDLRTPPGTILRTNRLSEPKGVVIRVAKPERKGVGGFLSGFANLFNPFAPVAKGVEARNQHWYDATIHAGPLPRGLRDERYHEAKTELFVMGIEGKGEDEIEVKVEPSPPVPTP